MWVPHPNEVQTFQSHGVGTNMGDVSDKSSVARFSLPGKFVLVWIKVHFSGGSSQATLSLKVDHHSEDDTYDHIEEQWDNMGTDSVSSMTWRPRSDEFYRYAYMPNDVLVFEWTNPNTQTWSVEVGLVALDASNNDNDNGGN